VILQTEDVKKKGIIKAYFLKLIKIIDRINKTDIRRKNEV